MRPDIVNFPASSPVAGFVFFTQVERNMRITKKQLKRIVQEESAKLARKRQGKLIKEYSDYASWDDLLDYVEDTAEQLDMAADKYVTSAWLYSGENKDNAIAEKIAEKLEQLYRDAESLGGLIRGSKVPR